MMKLTMLAGDTDGGSVKVDGVVPESRGDERVYNGDVVELGTKMRALKTPEKFPEGRARAGYLEETSELATRRASDAPFRTCIAISSRSLSLVTPGINPIRLQSMPRRRICGEAMSSD
jgi:hypothetical protein